MKWVDDSWVKLYRPTGAFMRLPVSVRGLAYVLLTYADPDGVVTDTEGEDAGAVIAYMLGAKPREHQRIAEDVAALLSDGYLVLCDRLVIIRNYSEAQTRRSAAAVRQARKRDRDRAARAVAADDDHVELPSVTGHGTRHVTNSDPVTGKERKKERTKERGSAAALRVLAELNQARARVIPKTRALTPTTTNLKLIEERLRDHPVEDLLHVISIYEAETRADQSKDQWFDTVTPFRPANFSKALARNAEIVKGPNSAPPNRPPMVETLVFHDDGGDA